MAVLRLGEIRFINTLPLSLPFSTLIDDMTIEKTVLPPTALNQLMLQEDLDVSPVSSAFYLRHQDQFERLDGISISAEQHVESVLLFLPRGFEGISQSMPLAVPDSSETSIALAQYLIFCKTGISFKGNLKTYPRGLGHAYIEQGIPVLAIGDEALHLKQRQSIGNTEIIDLAEFWYAETQLPFVFAVWVAQKSWAKQYPEELKQLNQLFVAQKETFYRDPVLQTQILTLAQKQCPSLPQSLLKRYFTEYLSYNLERPHLKALSLFEFVLRWLDNDQKEPPHWNCPELPVQLLHR